MIFRCRFTIGGGHVHCALFLAPGSNQTFAKCGDFCVRKGQEFQALLRDAPGFEFIAERPEDDLCKAITEEQP